MKNYENNRPVADFLCRECEEQFELKSQQRRIGRTVADGAYSTMIDRITCNLNPNFLILTYDTTLTVNQLQLVPKHFLSIQAIQKRKPLSANARRAGWQGCNILMEEIPESGRIMLVRDSAACPKEAILKAWKDTLFLRNQGNAESKSWLLSVMRCVDRLAQNGFTLDEVYGFESKLSATFPANRHVRAKIRQQLQVLRDSGYIKFLGGGRYCRAT
jgi:type II restriction enzyme